MTEVSLDPDLALALFVARRRCSTPLNSEDFQRDAASCRRTDSERVIETSPGQQRGVDLTINDSLPFTWFFRHQPGEGLARKHPSGQAGFAICDSVLQSYCRFRIEEL
jgi:hypothetical protein